MADKVMGKNSSIRVKAEGKDADGAPTLLADCTWSSGDTALFTVVADTADPTLATVTSAAQAGSGVLVAAGHGVDGAAVQDQKTIEVAAPAVALVITFL